MDDLLTWLRAQFDDDERAALETGASDHPAWHVLVTDEPSSPTPVQAAHITRHGPWRVRREVDAKRRILDLVASTELDPLDESDRAHRTDLDAVVRLLALPYANRPGYRDEWKP